MLCLASASMLSAQNATTTAGADGYLSRGIRMYDNKNFTGCIDQLSELKRLEAPASVYEDADFYIAMAKMQRNDADCVDALELFVEAYPASIHRLEARMALGDHYFYNNDFAAALRGYEGIPASAFDADKRGDLLFRRAFCRWCCRRIATVARRQPILGAFGILSGLCRLCARRLRQCGTGVFCYPQEQPFLG